MKIIGKTARRHGAHEVGLDRGDDRLRGSGSRSSSARAMAARARCSGTSTAACSRPARSCRSGIRTRSGRSREVLEESLDEGLAVRRGRSRATTRACSSCYGSNPLRRVRSYPLLLKNLWPKLAAVVTLDWRMTSTALQLGLRAAGRGLVRAHRAQMGDAADAVSSTPARRPPATTRRSRTGRSSRV